MSYSDDKYGLKAKSNAELHDWIAQYKQGTDEYTEGIEESMRRVAAMEELLEENEAPVWKRESIAMAIAILSLAVIIIAVVIMYE